MKKLQWAGLGLGAFLIVSPWLFGFSDITVMRWVNVLAGLAVVIMNAWAIFGEDREKRPSVAKAMEGKQVTSDK